MKNRRILVVDDNESLHEDFRKILSPGENDPSRDRIKHLENALFGDLNHDSPKKDSKVKFDMEFAQQGEEGFEKVVKAHHQNDPFSLIFMDMRMPPGWDGITTIAKIWEKVPGTEIVICTAYSDYSLDDILQKLGISDQLLFLKKPFDSVEVQQMALALTTKWDLNQRLRGNLENLEITIRERTKELDLERAKSINGAKLVALGEMAGGIAHEINNPLAIIHSNANLLKDLMGEGFDQAMGAKIADKIVTTADRIAKIIKGLRVFSRNGEADPVDSMETAQLIEETLGICREKFKIHDVKITVENAAPNALIECRQVQIFQVLLNLLNNAYDAIENLPDRWVKIAVHEVAETVEFSVTDCGKGLSREIIDKMYQPFFTTKGVGKGTGLGLSISKGIIESHKGRLYIDEKNPNTCFVISLPKHQASLSKKVG